MPWVAAAVAAVGLLVNASGQEKAKIEADKAADAARHSQEEQRSVVASQQASDRRAQVREERVRRARIMQGSENSGTAGSSSEAGAVGSIATQFFGNIGTSLGGQRVASNISSFQQTAADFRTQSNVAQQQAVMGGQAVQVAGNIFSQLYSMPTSSQNVGISDPTPRTDGDGGAGGGEG